MFSGSRSVRLHQLMMGISCLLLMAGSGITSHAQTWDLAGDFSGANNPNGAWTYGAYTGTGDTGFAAFTSESSTIEGAGNPAWHFPNGNPSGADIFLNTLSTESYGIGSGQVSLHADSGTPVARWTAPVTGMYDLAVSIGGTTANEGGGSGNADAHQSGLNINGVAQTGTYNASTNVYSWLIDNVSLSQGATVDAYVNQGYGSGNTQTIFTVNALASVPEMSTVGAMALMSGVGWIGLRRRQVR